jgi:hypothetical protein
MSFTPLLGGDLEGGSSLSKLAKAKQKLMKVARTYVNP